MVSLSALSFVLFRFSFVIIFKKLVFKQNSQGVVIMQLDFIGLACPMPVIKLKKYLAENKDQEIDVTLLLSDRSSLKDIPAFCKYIKLSCELVEESANIKFRVKG